MTEHDAELMAEIKVLADAAKKIVPSTIDILAAATTLAARFEHRTADNIIEQIRQHFRAEDLFWSE